MNMHIIANQHTVLGQVILTPQEVLAAIEAAVRKTDKFVGADLVISQPLPVVTVEARKPKKGKHNR